MENMNEQDLKNENCKEFDFLVISVGHEQAEIVKIQAGSEQDAYDLLQEHEAVNTDTVEIRLTEELNKSLKELF